MAVFIIVFLMMLFFWGALAISVFSGRSLNRGRCGSRQHIIDQSGQKIRCAGCSGKHKHH